MFVGGFRGGCSCNRIILASTVADPLVRFEHVLAQSLRASVLEVKGDFHERVEVRGHAGTLYDPSLSLIELSDLMVDTSEMPRKETERVEERKKFVEDRLAGGRWDAAGLSRTYGISRETEHGWVQRCLEGG